MSAWFREGEAGSEKIEHFLFRDDGADGEIVALIRASSGDAPAAGAGCRSPALSSARPAAAVGRLSGDGHAVPSPRRSPAAEEDAAAPGEGAAATEATPPPPPNALDGHARRTTA